MIVVLATDEEVHGVLQTPSKKAVDMDGLFLEHTSYIQGIDLDKELAKDPTNLTKQGTVKKDVLRKELKKRQVTFLQFLTEQKKFKAVDHIVYDF